jgi:nitrous oxidase accessory protein NosD
LLNRFGGRGRLSLVLVLIPSLATVAATSAAAKTLYVKPKGHNNTACTSVKPCRTIGFAVGQAHPGDTVRVAQGTYRATVSITKDIKLVGINRPVIEATRRINGILVSGARAKGAVVDGFAVRDALQEGILVTRTAAVTITDNLVHFNDEGAVGAHPTGE